MVAEGTSVMMFTHQHRLNCILPTGGQRLREILNERTTEFLRIFDVQVFHGINADVCDSNLSDVVINKASICLVIIPTEKHEAPEQRMIKRFTKNLYAIFLSVISFEVKGTIHLINSPHSQQLTNYLVHDLNNFFPITNATISQVNSSAKPLIAPVVLVNKACVGIFSLCETPIKP
ncbi:hypothetical protein ACFLV7_07920 [Chloroflexota bacterium]